MDPFQIVQPPTPVEHEPFIDGWFMFYILLILFYNCITVYSKVRKTKPESDEETAKRFVNEYVNDKGTIVWSFSTLVFFAIYGMWSLC